MANLNQVTLVGHLSCDPELRWTPSGTAVTLLSLAVNHRYRQGDQWVDDVCYVDCTVFGRQAEAATEHLSKGSPVLIEGRLRLRTWETQDGQKRSKHEVLTSNVQFLPRRSGGSEPALPEDLEDMPF
jgi:single-strand DNA-binding protein